MKKRIFTAICVMVMCTMSCSNEKKLRWCEGKGNIYAIHFFTNDTIIQTKWGTGIIERCEYCDIERLHLPECTADTNEIPIDEIYAIRGFFSDDFNEYYQQWHDPYKPEPQYHHIKESDIHKRK